MATGSPAPKATAAAVIVPVLMGVVASVAAGYSPDAKNTLARFGLALPERVSVGGIAIGDYPSVYVGGTAWMTWLGLSVVIWAAVYAAITAMRNDYDEDAAHFLEMPPDPTPHTPQPPQQPMGGHPMAGPPMGGYGPMGGGFPLGA